MQTYGALTVRWVPVALTLAVYGWVLRTYRLGCEEMREALGTVQVLFYCLFGLSVWSFVMCAWTDPGLATGYVVMTERSNLVGEFTYCEKCGSLRPARSHHCSQCNRCVLRRDHHCMWLGNCVGLHNHKQFVLLLLYTSLACLVGVWRLSPALTTIYEGNPQVVLLAVVFAAIGLVLCLLCGYQICLLCTNRTSIDAQSWSKYNEYDTSSCLTNMQATCGSGCWLLPLNPHISASY